MRSLQEIRTTSTYLVQLGSAINIIYDLLGCETQDTCITNKYLWNLGGFILLLMVPLMRLKVTQAT